MSLPEETNLGAMKDENLDKKPEETKKESTSDPFARLYRMDDKKTDAEPDKTLKEDKQGDKTQDKKAGEPGESSSNKEPENKGDGDQNPEQEYDEILYNKQKVKIPVTERQKYLQKGYNYDKVKQAADAANSTLQRILKLEGFDKVEDYLAELDRREKEKLVAQIEEAAGDTKAIDEIIKNHPIVRETQEEKQRIEEEKRKLDYSAKINELRKEQFFEELEPELNQLMEQNPNVDPSLAFSVLVGNYVRTGKLNELVQRAKETAEKKVVADMHDKERRATPTGGDTDEGNEVVQPSAFGSKLASIFGLDKAHAQKAAQRAHELLKRR